MSPQDTVYEQVSRFLPTDYIDIGVAVVEYSIEDAGVNHPKNYNGLTPKEIERKLRSKDITISKKDLLTLLENLSTNRLINSKRGHHYFAASRFT